MTTERPPDSAELLPHTTTTESQEGQKSSYNHCEMQLLLSELSAKRPSSAPVCSLPSHVQGARTQVLQRWAQYRTQCVTDRLKWAEIAEPDIRLEMPTGSFNQDFATQVVGHVRYLNGLDALLADMAEAANGTGMVVRLLDKQAGNGIVFLGLDRAIASYAISPAATTAKMEAAGKQREVTITAVAAFSMGHKLQRLVLRVDMEDGVELAENTVNSIRRASLHSLAAYLQALEQQQSKWATILEPDVVIRAPLAPYRRQYRTREEGQTVVLEGLEAMLLDMKAAADASAFELEVKLLEGGEEDIIWQGNRAHAQFWVQPCANEDCDQKNPINGCGMSAIVMWSASNRISKLELRYDVHGLMRSAAKCSNRVHKQHSPDSGPLLSVEGDGDMIADALKGLLEVARCASEAEV